MKFPVQNRRKRLWVMINVTLITALVTMTIYGGLFGFARINQWREHWLQFSAKLTTNLPAKLIDRFSPKVSEVRVHADHPMNLELVKPLIKIEAGEPLLNLAVERITAELSRFSEIRQVGLKRDFSGVVTVALKLRRPLAMVAGSSSRWVDHQGVIYTASVPPNELDLPVITGVPFNWQSDTRARRQLMLVALKLAHQVNPTLLASGQELAEVHVDPLIGYSIYASGVGGEILFGLPPFNDKIARLQILLKSLAAQLEDIEMVDLDYNKKAYVRFKPKGSQVLAGVLKKMQIQGSGKLTTGGVLSWYVGGRKVVADAEDALFQHALAMNFNNER